MKIETLNEDWKPIVVTIETREEALELVNLIAESYFSVDLLEELFTLLKQRT